jgi:hypothetical protein
MESRWRRIFLAAAMAGSGLGAQAALAVVAAGPAGASTALTFVLSPCPGSGATGHGGVTISQTGKSLTIVNRVHNDLPDANEFVLVADATQQNVFGAFPLNSKGSALFEVHQTTTIPTGVNRVDSIVFGVPTGPDSFDIIMASDPANCGV